MKNTILNVWIITLASICIIACNIKIAEAKSIAQNTVSEPYIPSETSSVVDITTNEYKNIRNISDTEDTQELRTLIQECKTSRDSAQQILDSATSLGYTNSHPVIQVAQAEIKQMNQLIKIYTERLEQQRWKERTVQYPTASSIWLYLKDAGYSDEICAGILGNLMAEVGGQTLNLEPYTNTHPGYYGICQWSLEFTDTHDLSLTDQCVYLVDTLENEMNNFGNNYHQGFNYDEFIKMTNVEEIAIAFAKCYERCGPGSYDVRQSNALIAFEYFTS